MRIGIIGKIIDLFFPRYCPVCGNRLAGEEEGLCMACILHLPRTNTWDDPYENDLAKMFWHQIPVERCCALFYYAGHSFSSNILYQLKYDFRPELGFIMGKMLAEEGLRIGFFEGIDTIVPIPLAKKRQKERGYNQSEEIARGISMLTHIPVENGIVRRSVFNGSQTHKDRWGRTENVKDVFELTEDYRPEGKKGTFLEGKHLLMVDDVCTTGATILSCSKTMCGFQDVRFSVIVIGYAKN